MKSFASIVFFPLSIKQGYVREPFCRAEIKKSPIYIYLKSLKNIRNPH